MPQTDFLIVGLGIAGTLVSYELYKAGKSFIVIDDPVPAKSSLVAGAVINPVNVHQWKKAPGCDTYIPAALQTYREIELSLGCNFLYPKTMLVTISSNNESPANPVNNFTSQPNKDEVDYLQQTFGAGERFTKLENVWQVDIALLYEKWRSFLQSKNLLLEERLDLQALMIRQDKANYRDILASKIIFCEGAAAAANPLWAGLPFTRNRGEALLLSIPQLDAAYIYQSKIRLAPAAGGLFWCGSNYVWQYNTLQPDENWKEKTMQFLQQWLQIPFKIVNHIVAERPTTAGQELLAGIHPHYPSLAMLNGLGTKGFSAAPLLAQTLVAQLTGKHSDLTPLVKSLENWL